MIHLQIDLKYPDQMFTLDIPNSQAIADVSHSFGTQREPGSTSMNIEGVTFDVSRLQRIKIVEVKG